MQPSSSRHAYVTPFIPCPAEWSNRTASTLIFPTHKGRRLSSGTPLTLAPSSMDFRPLAGGRMSRHCAGACRGTSRACSHHRARLLLRCGAVFLCTLLVVCNNSGYCCICRSESERCSTGGERERGGSWREWTASCSAARWRWETSHTSHSRTRNIKRTRTIENSPSADRKIVVPLPASLRARSEQQEVYGLTEGGVTSAKHSNYTGQVTIIACV